MIESEEMIQEQTGVEVEIIEKEQENAEQVTDESQSVENEETETTIENIMFPDQNFKIKLFSLSQQIDKNVDKEISYEEATLVTDLNLSNMYPDGERIRFDNLSGIEHFVNLESLDITSNGVTDLSPIKNLKSLKKFSTVYNSIEDLTPLQNLTNLETLEIYIASATDVTPLRN